MPAGSTGKRVAPGRSWKSFACRPGHIPAAGGLKNAEEAEKESFGSMMTMFRQGGRS